MTEQIRVTELGPDDQLIVVFGDPTSVEAAHRLAAAFRSEATVLLGADDLEVVVRRQALRADRRAEGEQ